MNRKELFINWLLEDKLSGITKTELADVLQKVFKQYYNVDIWQINNIKFFIELREKIKENKKLLYTNPRDYYIVKNNSYYYQVFLSQNLKNNIKQVNFYEDKSYDDSLPVHITYFNEKKSSVKTWQDCLKMVVQCLYEDYFDILINKQNFLSNNENNFGIPLEIEKDVYIEGNICANETINLIKTLLNDCNIDYENVIIKYKTKNNETNKNEESININKPLRILWTKYETALLIEAYLKIEDNPKERDVILKNLSKTLRQLAINENIKIDEIYRNFNGVTIMYRNIESIFKTQKSCMHGSKLFEEMVFIYKNKFQDFCEILKEAYLKVDPNLNLLPPEQKFNSFLLKVDFKSRFEELNTRPFKMKLFDKVYYFDTWKDLYVKVFEILDYKNSTKYLDLVDDYLINEKNNAYFLSKNPDNFLRSEKINDKFYIEICLNILSITERIKVLFSLYDIDLSNLNIWYYFYKEVDKQIVLDLREKELSDFDEKLLEDTKNILELNFKNGIRLNSIIDYKKFKRIYYQNNNAEFDENIVIEYLLKKVGINVDGKIYVVTENQKNLLTNILNELQEENTKVIYYENLYNEKIQYFMDNNISHKEYMIEILKENFANLIFEKERFLFNNNDSIENELENLFLNKGSQNYEQINEKLKFLNFEDVKHILNSSNKFTRIANETFDSVNNLYFDQNEIDLIKEKVENDISINQKSYLKEFNIKNSIEMNENISEDRLQIAIFNKYFSNGYKLIGKFIVEKNKQINITQIIEDYLNSVDEINVEDIYNYEKNITGKEDIGFYIANKVLFRIDRDNFVNLKNINVDILKTDYAISQFANKIISITDITSFTAFPEIENYSWNLYFVESFVKHFSKMFDIYGSPAKKQNIGAICKKDKNFKSYEDLLANVIKENCKGYTQDEYMDYLFKKSFIGKKTQKLSKEIKERLQ